MDFGIFFENPLFSLLLVAVISSFLERKKKVREPEGPRRTNQPLDKRSSQTQTSLEEVRELFKELSRSFSSPTAASNQKREDHTMKKRRLRS